jgi:hypothetical protein
MIPVLLLVTAFFRPAAPTVGDPITIQFPASVRLDASRNYEIVSQSGKTVVIRSFQPQPFAISGRTGDVVFRNMVVPMRSVLKPNDSMTPADLKPPRREPLPRVPFIAIALAALAAVAAWTIAAMRPSRQMEQSMPALTPSEQFRSAIASLRRDDWARLADALRQYLAATSSLGLDMTTTEVLARRSEQLIVEILRQGDLEKFSPWGPAPADFHEVARRALELAA